MIKVIKPEDVFPLRRAVLRKICPMNLTSFSVILMKILPFHLGYFEKNELIGIVTLMKNGNIAQLRGMAHCRQSSSRKRNRKKLF